MTHSVVFGIGGTGAKCIEAVVHLAASGHTTKVIYPISIDEDSNNGNVRRCINALQTYNEIREQLPDNTCS